MWRKNDFDIKRVESYLIKINLDNKKPLYKFTRERQ